MDEDQEICRVCRCESTVHNPLYYPCKCAGSIRFVHQNCLLEWLSHSKNKYCELCEHPFTFTPIYHQDMPTSIPVYILIRQCFSSCGTIIQTGFRALAVAIVWLVLLPYMILWSWRFYFWSSERIGSRDSTNTQQVSSNKHQQVPHDSIILSTSSQSFDYNFWKFLADCFEGQVITLLIMVVVVTVYLFKEWVEQNTPVDADQDSDIEQVMEPWDADDTDINDSSVRQDQQRTSIYNDHNDAEPISPIAQQKVAVDVLLTALKDIDDNGGNDITTSTSGKNDIKCRLKDLQHDLQHELEHEHKQHAEPTFQRYRLSNDENNIHHDFTNGKPYQLYNNNNDDDEAEVEFMMQSIMIKDPTDALKRYSWNDLQKHSHKQRQPQSPISKQINKQPPINRFFDNSETMIIGRSSTTIANLDEECDHTTLASFSRGQRELPKKTTRTDLYCQHQATENRLSNTQVTSPLEKKHRHDNTHTNTDDILCRPLISSTRSSSSSFSQLRLQASSATATTVESDEKSVNQQHVPPLFHSIKNDDYYLWDTQRMEQQYDNNSYGRDILEMFDLNDGILNHANEDDVLDLADDMDGVLEAIGMRGNPWILVQNSVLVCIMVSMCLGISVWIPHIIGRLVILVRPISLIEQVVYTLRYVTDPVVDGIIDGCLPLLFLAAETLDSLYQFLVPSDFVLVGQSISMGFMAMTQPFTKNGFFKLPSSLSLWSLNGETPSPSDSLLFGKFDATIMARQLVHHQTNNDIKHSFGLLLNFLYTMSDKLTQRWHQLPTGKSALDRGMCIIVGYVTLLTVGSWYLSYLQQHQQCNNNDDDVDDDENDNGRCHYTTGSSISELIRQQGIFFKVFFFILLEVILLPIICGILLDLATLPLIANSTVFTRWAFTIAHPYCGCFLHWFVGTVFLFHFAVFISMCREIVRPGVMWFIRDPNDPQFHPVQEIMERPLSLLLRKLCAGALIYLALIIVGTGAVIWAVSKHAGIYPFRWSFDVPLSTLAIDLLTTQFLVPLLIVSIKPRYSSKKALTLWWHTTSRWLRLSSFMFGERYLEEETCIWDTMNFWLPYNKLSVSVFGSSSSSFGKTGARNIDVSPKVDGQLVRVPKRDNMMVHSDWSMFVAVDPTTLEPLDPVEKCDGYPTSTEKCDGKEHNTTIVYIPPLFKIRIALFLFLMWLSGSVVACSITVGPLLLGRLLFQVYLGPNKPVHDLYSFMLGAYMAVFLVKILYSVARGYSYYFKCYNHGSWLSLLGKSRIILRQNIAMGCKFIYLILTAGCIIPLLVGVAIDLYVLAAMRYTKSSQAALVLYLSEDWSLGIVCLGIVYGILYIIPTNSWQRSLDRYMAEGWMTLDIWTLTDAILGPWILGSVCAILIPGGTAYALIHLLDVQDTAIQLMIFRYIYPIILCIGTVLATIGLGTRLVNLWIQSIRDDTYLVGKQLHNLDK